MKSWTKIAVGFFATFGLLYVGFVAVASFLAERTCTVYPVGTVTSPNGKWKAVQTQEVCNDDNQAITAVWVSDSKSGSLGKKFSAFRAIASQSTSSQRLDLQLVWLSDSQLQIAYPKGTELQHKERTEGDVIIKYLELSPSTHNLGS